MMNKNTQIRRNRQGGFTLVEALVALVVLSIGMLGIAALYVESLRSGRGAILRTQAVMLAGDMADRIRANRLGNDAYVKAVTDHPATNAACAPGGAGCTPAALAAHDLALWDASLIATLPGATGAVAAVNNGDQTFTYTITVNWTEVGQEADVSYVVRIRA